MVKSHLEYANCICSPHTAQDKTTGKGTNESNYVNTRNQTFAIDRLKYFNIPTLVYRRFRRDMIMVFKLLTDIYDSNIACQLVKPNNFVTRGHHLRLYKQHVQYDLCKYLFTNRIVSNWNGLPDNVITSNSVGIFENRLDKF